MSKRVSLAAAVAVFSTIVVAAPTLAQTRTVSANPGYFMAGQDPRLPKGCLTFIHRDGSQGTFAAKGEIVQSGGTCPASFNLNGTERRFVRGRYEAQNKRFVVPSRGLVCNIDDWGKVVGGSCIPG